MKVIVTGATGILGTDIVRELQSGNHEVLGFDSQNIALADYQDVRQKFTQFPPDVIIHSAAMTNVDACETDRVAALKTNVAGTHIVSMVASQLGARIVYISSCGVYGDGKAEAHTELDATNPLNFHHYTKLEGEKRVREHNPHHLIVRPGWLFGGSQEHRKNFVEARRREAATRPVLQSANDKFGSPTSTSDLARQLVGLLKQDIFGTFNIVNTGSASRYEYVSEIIRLLKLNNQVEPVSSTAFERPAAMPTNEVLENMNLELLGINIMTTWQEALSTYIKHNY